MHNLIKKEIIFNSEEELKMYFRQFAKALIQDNSKSNVLCLYGTLGAGKTTIAREIIRSICGADTIVQSPTYNLLQIYDTSKLSIYHFDLYRLENENDAFELGLEEALANNLSIIEWPELIEHLLPKDSIKIYISVNATNQRICNFSSSKILF